MGAVLTTQSFLPGGWDVLREKKTLRAAKFSVLQKGATCRLSGQGQVTPTLGLRVDAARPGLREPPNQGAALSWTKEGPWVG